ncbi:MAG: hypothetical protein ACMUIU_09960 [bacterium]
MGLGISLIVIGMFIIIGMLIMGIGIFIMGSGITIIGTGIIIPGSVIPGMGPPVTIIGESIINGPGIFIMGYAISISIIGGIPIPIIGNVPIFSDGNMPWLIIEGLFRASMAEAAGAPLIKDIVAPPAWARTFIPFIAISGSLIMPKVTGDIPMPKTGDIVIPKEGTAPKTGATGSNGILIGAPARPSNIT